MASAIDSLLDTVDRAAEEGEIAAARASVLETLKTPGDPIELPDGRRIYPPRVLGIGAHEIIANLLDAQDPSRSRFVRLIGPPGTGKSQLARAAAHHLWAKAGKEVGDRHGQPFYGLVEINGGPSSDEFLFRYDYIPDPEDGGRVRLVEAAFARAMREGHLVMIDEANTIRDVALLSINATLDGRLTLYLPATGETVRAAPGFGVILAYNPGLVGATDIPDAWRSRFPATIEVTSNWGALLDLGAPRDLVHAAAHLDRERVTEEQLSWTPQFRDIEALADMMRRLDDRTGIALFVSNIAEQVAAGAITDAEAAAACRMLDEAGYKHLRVPATSKTPNLNGYPRAVTA